MMMMMMNAKSAFHPFSTLSTIPEYQLRLGKQRQVGPMVHSVSGWRLRGVCR